ncbi:MAG: RluA family pseudouridine synthase [Leptospiraceae bacterium]|nr:RluA family pseudouridine synthase [Leptospiraceae bacterium]
MKVYRFKVAAGSTTTRIDNFLKDNLSEAFSKSLIRKLILAGAVYVNKKRIKNAGYQILNGQTVELYYRQETKSEKQKFQEFNIEKAILYHDKHVLIINKPAGLPTQPTLDDSRNNLIELLKKHLQKIQSIENPYLGIHHRLDADTSGLLLFTTDKSANKSIAKQFQEREIKKKYLALCEYLQGHDTPPALLNTNEEYHEKRPLSRIQRKVNKYAVDLSSKENAHTILKTVKIKNNKYLIEAIPVTGRSHQIRVHLSANALPILGDRLYHPRRQNAVTRLMLHAMVLEFVHPISARNMSFSIPSIEIEKAFEDTIID